MGLATAQARFLGITARKADCEYKSTELQCLSGKTMLQTKQLM